MNRTIAALGGALIGLALVSGISSAASPGVRVVSNGPRSGSQVALTFDDGASPANCRRILAILVARHVPATFFPIGRAMEADPAFWRMVVAEGDPIGDHTLTHPELPTLTEAQQFAQIDGDRRLAERISGAPLLRVFRPPYGAYNDATISTASKAGFPTVLLWDTSDRDTSPHGSLAHMLGAAEAARPGSVILMHCGPDATPYLLGPLLDNLASRGLQPVTVPQLLGLRWTASPASSRPTPVQILDGLTPLPSSSSGGVVIGPNGIGSMTFPPAPPSAATASASPAVGSASPAPTRTAPATLPPSATASVPPATLSSESTPTDSGTPANPPAASGSPTAAEVPLLGGLLAALIAAFALVIGVARRRRR